MTFGWQVPRTLGPLVVGCAFLVLFILYEWKGTSTGLCHHALFDERNYALALGAIIVEGAILFGEQSLLRQSKNFDLLNNGAKVSWDLLLWPRVPFGRLQTPSSRASTSPASTSGASLSTS